MPVSVYRISNGFLLSILDMHSKLPTLVYCKDAAEIGECIATLHTRVAIGIAPDVHIPIHSS